MATALFMRNARRSVLTCRFYTTPAEETPSIRKQLTDEVKNALKAKDSFKSTLLRSVLSEVYAADKEKGHVPSPVIVSLMRKAIARRNEAVTQYRAANREDLAEKEATEVAVLEGFLPPLLSEEEIDTRLRAAIESSGVQSAKTGTGKILKAFYMGVDKSMVDGTIVKQRLDALAASS